MNKFAKGWLRGFFDGEGCIFIKLGKAPQICISVVNTDVSLMNTCAEYLNLLGITFRRYDKPKRDAVRKPIITFQISAHSEILKFHKLVGFASHIKTLKLNKAVTYIHNRAALAINRIPSKELLSDLYVSQQLSLEMVSLKLKTLNKVGADYEVLRRLLVQYKIRVRTHGESMRLTSLRRMPPISEKLLRELYNHQKMSLVEIAEYMKDKHQIVRCDGSYYRYLFFYGIPHRNPRGGCHNVWRRKPGLQTYVYLPEWR